MNIIKTASCSIVLLAVLFTSCKERSARKPVQVKEMPGVTLLPSQKFIFNSFVDCNMATVWVGDTFRIFPGKYGEDPLWGDAHELKYASGSSVDEVFAKRPDEFTEPSMPPNAPAGGCGFKHCLPLRVSAFLFTADYGYISMRVLADFGNPLYPPGDLSSLVKSN
ncbi:MAG: hypothetical protein ACTHNG_09400 [Ginsengibacter sp.]